MEQTTGKFKYRLFNHSKKKIIFGANKYRQGEIFATTASNKNHKKIGFKSQYTLEAGLKKL